MKRNHQQHPLDDEIKDITGKVESLHSAGLTASERALERKLKRLIKLRNQKRKQQQDEQNGE